MPRAGWVKPQSDQRVSDHIAIGLLTRVFPPDVVDAVVRDAGRVQLRHRLLPSRVVAYYVMALALFPDASYVEVMRMLVQGLSWSSGWSRRWEVPSSAALSKARTRLGFEPMRLLFDQVAVPLTTPGVPGGFYRAWRVVSVDGTCVDVPDTAANDQEFGRPAGPRSGSDVLSTFPQVRMVGLVESGSHAVIAVAVGGYRQSEVALFPELFESMRPGMLVLADRNFYSFAAWQSAASSGADLLWRMRSTVILESVQELEDGSFLARIYPGTQARRHDRDWLQVRVLRYTVSDDGQDRQDYRLVTTITDPQAAPAEDLAALYRQRWEIETAFAEMKTTQLDPRRVLRSTTPDGVRQEVYGLLCVHYAIRCLMHQVATDFGTDPDQLSFISTIRSARRSTASHPGFSPHTAEPGIPPTEH